MNGSKKNIILSPKLSPVILTILFFCFNIGKDSYSNSELFNGTSYDFNEKVVIIVLIIYSLYFAFMYFTKCKENKNDSKTNFGTFIILYLIVAFSYIITSVTRISIFGNSNFPSYVKYIVFFVPLLCYFVSKENN